MKIYELNKKASPYPHKTLAAGRYCRESVTHNHMKSKRKPVNASLHTLKMSKSRNNKLGKEDRFTYRTSLARGHRIRQRALDLVEPIEEVLDMAVDRYLKDPKTNNAMLPRNPKETRYCERLMRFLRDKEAESGYLKVLDLILSEYEE